MSKLQVLQAVKRKEGISPKLDKVFDKLVKQPRGGYCFEQNTLFLAVLRTLGFTVYPVAARYCTPKVKLIIDHETLLYSDYTESIVPRLLALLAMHSLTTQHAQRAFQPASTCLLSQLCMQ